MQKLILCNNFFTNFHIKMKICLLRPTARSAKRVLAIVILSARLTRPSTDSSPDETTV